MGFSPFPSSGISGEAVKGLAAKRISKAKNAQTTERVAIVAADWPMGCCRFRVKTAIVLKTARRTAHNNRLPSWPAQKAASLYPVGNARSVNLAT